MASIEVSVSNEMIEKIVKEQIRSKIDKYLNDYYDKGLYFTQVFERIARQEIARVITDKFIEDTCREINKNIIVENVTTRIAEQITTAVRNLDY